jgi:hypothetical protein
LGPRGARRQAEEEKLQRQDALRPRKTRHLEGDRDSLTGFQAKAALNHWGRKEDSLSGLQGPIISSNSRKQPAFRLSGIVTVKVLFSSSISMSPPCFSTTVRIRHKSRKRDLPFSSGPRSSEPLPLSMMDPLSGRSGFDRLYIGTSRGNLKARKDGNMDLIESTRQKKALGICAGMPRASWRETLFFQRFPPE